MIEGVCVGVDDAPLCDRPTCTDGITCARVIEIASDTALQAQGTDTGDCLALAPGVYGHVRLAAGASLFGRGHREVMLRSITVAGTGKTTIRGVSADSIVAHGHTELTLDRVMVEGSVDAGVTVTDGELTLLQSTIRRGSGPGVVLNCLKGCPIGARQKLLARTTWIDAQKRIGLWALGADVDLRDVVITRIAPHSFLYGRGIEVSKRSTLHAAFVRVEDSADVALFVHDSAGTLGPGIEILRGARGIHLAAIPEGGVVLDGFRLKDVGAVSLGIAAGSRGVVVRNGVIVDTKLMRVPVDIGGQVDVGDAIAWFGDAEANVESTVTIERSARRPAVIMPSARGTFAAKLVGDDASRGIVIRAKRADEHPGLTIAPGINVDYSTAAISVPPSSAP